MSSRVLSLGEALIDVVIRPESTQEHVGGSLLNVAVGHRDARPPGQHLCLLGQRPPGRSAQDSGRSPPAWRSSPGTDSADKTSVAFAHIDDEGHATYEFDLTWEVPQVPDLATVRTSAHRQHRRHPRARRLGGGRHRRPDEAPRHGLIRPEYPSRTDEFTRRRDGPRRAPGRAVRRGKGQRRGSRLAVSGHPGRERHAALGQGGSGDGGRHPRTLGCLRATDATTATCCTSTRCGSTVGDTVGAGDSFMAGLISGLLDAGLLGSPQARQRLGARLVGCPAALHRAVITSALTVSRSGAYAPTMAEVEACRRQTPRSGNAINVAARSGLDRSPCQPCKRNETPSV